MNYLLVPMLDGPASCAVVFATLENMRRMIDRVVACRREAERDLRFVEILYDDRQVFFLNEYPRGFHGGGWDLDYLEEFYQLADVANEIDNFLWLKGDEPKGVSFIAAHIVRIEKPLMCVTDDGVSWRITEAHVRTGHVLHYESRSISLGHLDILSVM